jgi:TonB family protein
MSTLHFSIIVQMFLANSAALGSPTADTTEPVALPPIEHAQVPEYPQHSLRLDEQGVVEVSFWIEQSGETSRCLVIKSSGYPRLDQATCNTISNLTFKPLQAEAIGPFTKTIRWQFDPSPARKSALFAIPDQTRGMNKTLLG